MITKRRSWCTGVVLLGLVLTGSRPAWSQGANSTEAEALFREGKRLLEAGHYGEACPKLADSYQLDPATGALLALAICREGEGKIASAWTAYADVAARARAEGRPDREQAARARLTALEPQLALLTITIPDGAGIAGLKVERDGAEVPKAAWGLAVPVDPGNHLVRASAAGRQPWTFTATLGGTTKRVTITVPILAEVTPQTDRPRKGDGQPTASTVLVTRESSGVDGHKGRSGGRIVGLAIAGAGILALGGAGVFALKTVDKKHDYQAESCPSGNCADYRAAVNDGNIATGLSIGGLIGLVAGSMVYLLARPESADGSHSAAALQVGPVATAAGWKLGIAGTF